MLAREGWGSLSLPALGTTPGTARSPPSCVTLSKSVSLSELQSWHLQVTISILLTSKDPILLPLRKVGSQGPKETTELPVPKAMEEKV